MTVFSYFLFGLLLVVVADGIAEAIGHGIGKEVGEAVERALSKRH